MPAKFGAKLKIIRGVRFVKGQVKCENCGEPFKMFWREDFILSRQFDCADCDLFIAGAIEQADEAAVERAHERWPIVLIKFDL